MYKQLYFKVAENTSFIIEIFSKLQLLNHIFLQAYLFIFETELLNLPIYIGQLINPPNI